MIDLRSTKFHLDSAIMFCSDPVTAQGSVAITPQPLQGAQHSELSPGSTAEEHPPHMHPLLMQLDLISPRAACSRFHTALLSEPSCRAAPVEPGTVMGHQGGILCFMEGNGQMKTGLLFHS